MVGWAMTIPNRRRGRPSHSIARRGVAFAAAHATRWAARTAARNVVPAAKAAGKALGGYLRKKSGTGGGNYARKHVKSKSEGALSVDTGAGGELTRINIKGGSKLKMGQAKMTDKLVKANTQFQMYRFGGVQPFMNTTLQSPTVNGQAITGGGFYPLVNMSQPNTIGGYKVSPLHIWDVTSQNNYINGTYTGANPGTVLSWWYGTGSNSQQIVSPYFPYLYGANSNSSATTLTWQNEDTTGFNNNNVPNRRDILDYVQAKMLCYGASQQATNYKIEFIQLKDDEISPNFNGPNSNPIGYYGGSNLPYLSNTVAFWQGYSAASEKHPIQTINPEYKKHMRVIKTINFTLNPRLSTETDAAVGHAKQLNIFMRFNRTCKYDWLQTAIDTNIDAPTAFIQNQGTVQCYVEPRARIYMTVQATSLSATIVNPGSNTTNVNYTPSYDLILRVKHLQVS